MEEKKEKKETLGEQWKREKRVHYGVCGTDGTLFPFPMTQKEYERYRKYLKEKKDTKK